MKKILIVVFLTAGLARIQAQGTMQFTITLNGANEVPPNSSPGFGSGTLTLSGTDLSYLFSGSDLFAGNALPTDATINGPANASFIAPMLFDLGAPTIVPIQPPPVPAIHGKAPSIICLALKSVIWKTISGM